MKISFGDMYTDGGITILDLLNVTTQDSQFFAELMKGSSINLQKVQSFVN